MNSDSEKCIIVTIKPRKNSRAVCSLCQTESPGYDKTGKRLFEFIPAWGFHVFFEYNMRRVQCSKCKKVVVEKVPWADGKNHFTFFYIKYLADWTKEMAWKTVAKGSRRLLWVGKDRTKKTLRRFFSDMWNLDRKFRKNIKVFCTDMWRAYLGLVPINLSL